MMMNKETTDLVGGLMILGIVGIAVFAISTAPIIREHQIARDEFEDAIENDYTAYLDGDEVDISKLDTYNYVVTVDSESKSIYLTDKGFWDWGQVIRIK